MRSIAVPCSVFVRDVTNHREIKHSILDRIASMGSYSHNNKSGKITNTDWHLPPNYGRPYAEIVLPVFEEHNIELSKTIDFNYLKTQNFWFQQYHKGDWHSWHNHESCMFSNVYYVSLDGTPKTTLRYLGEEFEIEVKEGQILSFPSIYTHCSKENKSDNVKTIIAFNTNGMYEISGY